MGPRFSRSCLVAALSGLALCGCASNVVVGIYDALESDGGDPVDAGLGGGDGGAAELVLVAPALVVVEVDAGAPMSVSVFNAGAQDALAVTLSATLPSGVSAAPAGACTSNDGGLTCGLGTLASGARADVPLNAAFSLSPRWFEVTARAATSSPEATAANNQATIAISLTPQGAMPVPIIGDRTLTVTFCSGTNITSFSQCVAGSQLSEVVTLFADGGVLDDIGFPGFWGQSAHQRNLAIRFNDGTTPGASYSGGSVSALCFEGPLDNYQGVANSGAWRGCLN